MTARWERQLHRLREAPVPLERVRERAQQPPRPGSPLPPKRERVIAGVVAIAVFVAVAAFGWRAFNTGDATAPVDAPPALPASSFSLWLSAERVPPSAVELVAMLVNHDGTDAIFGVFATLDRWDGDEWVPYGSLVMCLDHWHCTASVQRPGGSGGGPGIGLSARPGGAGPVERFTTDGLDVGWYRISQEANEGIVAAAVFEIVEGAPAPAPLVSIDAPAISVTPALVSPDGAEIDLYPLIPAPTGAQSREDVLEAVRGLSEVARLERWNGSTWEAAGEIQLREAVDDLARSAELPPLPGGEYRLVREGPEGRHIGHFWVDEGSRSLSFERTTGSANGWYRYADPVSGVSIEVPADWTFVQDPQPEISDPRMLFGTSTADVTGGTTPCQWLSMVTTDGAVVWLVEWFDVVKLGGSPSDFASRPTTFDLNSSYLTGEHDCIEEVPATEYTIPFQISGRYFWFTAAVGSNAETSLPSTVVEVLSSVQVEGATGETAASG
jgi:hypothetical protein